MTTPTTAPPAAFKIDEFIDAARIPDDMAINHLDLMKDLERQPALIYFYTSLSAKADRQVATIKLNLEAREAMAATKVRQDAAAAGEKVTVDAIAAKVRQVPEILRLDANLIKAQEIAKCLVGAVTALRDKTSMLQSVSLITRDEMKAKLDFDRNAGQGPVGNTYTGSNARDRANASRLSREASQEKNVE